MKCIIFLMLVVLVPSTRDLDWEQDSLVNVAVHAHSGFQKVDTNLSTLGPLSASWVACPTGPVLKWKLNRTKGMCPTDVYDVYGFQSDKGFRHCCCKPGGVTKQNGGFNKPSIRFATGCADADFQKAIGEQQEKEMEAQRLKAQLQAKRAAEFAALKEKSMCPYMARSPFGGSCCAMPEKGCKYVQGQGLTGGVCQAAWTCGGHSIAPGPGPSKCTQQDEGCFTVQGQEKVDGVCKGEWLCVG